MRNGADRPVPRQRTKDLVVRHHGDGTLVLDRRTDTAHYLPADVMRVWVACTGKQPLAEVASAAGIDEQVAAGAVDQLIELDLLDVPAGIERRKFLRRSAIVGAGALAVPVIETVAASPAWAQGTEPIVIPNPDFVPSCSPAMNSGNNQTTVTFQIRLLSDNYAGSQYYTVTLDGVPGESYWWRYGGVPTASETAVIILNPAGNPPTANSSTIQVGGPNTNPGNPYNAGPLPAVLQISAVVCPTGNTPGGTPTAPCVTEQFTLDNPCCANGYVNGSPPGCILPGLSASRGSGGKDARTTRTSPSTAPSPTPKTSSSTSPAPARKAPPSSSSSPSS